MNLEHKFRVNTAFTVDNGKVVFDDAGKCKQALQELQNGKYYLLPKKATKARTTSQNSRLWRLYAEVAAWYEFNEAFRDMDGDIITLTPEMIHLWAKHEFRHLLPRNVFITGDGEIIETEATTVQLTAVTVEGSKSYEVFYNAVAQFFSERTNYEISV